MKIVVLDGYTCNPGDLSWKGLETLGECKVYDRTPPAETAARARGAEILLTNKTVLDRNILTQLPGLRYIGVLATGYNVVDISAARELKVTVTNVPAYSTPSVAQTVFALLLELTHNAGAHTDSVRRGEWARSKDFCYWLKPPVELAGLTMGLVGLGRIGRQVAIIAQAFGMKVIAHAPRPPAEPVHGVTMVDLAALFRESDVVSLHCPLTPETKGLINAARLATMKPTAYLINTGRGPLVDEPALAAALNTGKLAGAGLDVLSTEPPATDNPLTSARNCVITPHIAWASLAARRRLLDVAIGNVRAFISGKPANVVS